MLLKKTLQFLSGVSLVMLVLMAFGPIISRPVSAQTAPTEPTCQNVTNTPAFNPYPLTTSQPNPDITSNNCKDMPLLSYFPVDANNNNPRNKTITQNQNFSIHIYYNNGATAGGACIQSPNVKVEVIRESGTQYRIRATLSGANVPTVTSAQKGGDLILTVPDGTVLDIVGNNTLHYIDAIERKYQADTQGTTPYDRIQDNSQGTVVSNPIYTAFPNKNLPSSAGFQMKNCLESGFLGYGYILSQISAIVQAPNTNLPPQVPGQEITIIRGETGSFQPYNGTDPEGNYPLTYIETNLPPFCVVNRQTNVVTCQTNQQTPTRTTFVVTPTDSLGLVGTPGTFIVNVIDPGLNIFKDCVKKGTQAPCSSAGLKAGDEVTYTITVISAGQAPATNVRVTDTYDKNRLENITNINPNGTLDTNAGTIVWQLGTMNPNDNRKLTFDAKIQAGVANGDIIVNIAKVTADNLPEKEARAEFPIGSAVLQSEKLCVKKGTSTPCSSANLTINDQVGYIINVRNTGAQAVNNVRVVDTYDRARLTNITNINPNGELDANAGTITWQVGTINPGEVKTLTFEATIATGVANGDIIINRARITADGQPEQIVQVQFPVVIQPPVTPRSGGVTAFLLTAIGLIVFAGGIYYYQKNNKVAKAFTPKRSEEIKLEKLDEKKK